jgi:plasmid maintenance system antidote protein VapI
LEIILAAPSKDKKDMTHDEVELTHLYILLRVSESEAELFIKSKRSVPPEMAARIKSLKTEIAEKEKCLQTT